MYITGPRNESSNSVFERMKPYASSLMMALDLDPEQPPTSFTADYGGRFYALRMFDTDPVTRKTGQKPQTGFTAIY